MIDAANTAGYYVISLSHTGPGKLLRSNNERAFVISQLQDLLTPRLLLPNIPAHRQLSSCIDLLAFSLIATKIDFVTFTIDLPLLKTFIDTILSRLIEFRDSYEMLPRERPSVAITVQKLAGPHHALERTINLHLQHLDWEYDRYSSIGFYLHDRRGDWMRTWRLAHLFDGNSDRYREYLACSQLSATEPLLNLRPSSP